MSSKNRNKRPTSIQHVRIVVTMPGAEQDILACHAEKDSIHVSIKLADDGRANIYMSSDEAEDFFDQAISLVSDDKQRPIAGHVFIDTTTGENGGRMAITVADPEAYTATVTITQKTQVGTCTVDRGVLERWLFSVVEGLLQEMEDDD
jgi:hypothetical protein